MKDMVIGATNHLHKIAVITALQLLLRPRFTNHV